MPLVLIFYADKDLAFRGQFLPGRYLALCVSRAEGGVYAHHLAGRSHLGAEDGIHAGKPYKREDGFLDSDEIEPLLFREPELIERLSQHYLCRQFCERDADRFAHKGDGSRPSRI